MIKKLLTAGMTLALLWGCYVAYGHGFDLVVHQFRTYRSREKGGFDIHPSRNKQRTIALARESFGPKHWSVTSDQPFTYYSPDRGFWMYSLDVKEIQEEDGVRYDGKRLKMKPFAMIIESKDGRKHQTLTADRATLDLSQPISLSSKQGNDAMKVTHALIEGNVCIRDDHGTPMNLSDDMNIGPMTHLVFDEEKQQFTTDSQFVMRDAELTAIGEGMVLQMRKKDPNELAAGQSSGSEAEYLILKKSVRVTVRDVGNSGVLASSGPARKSREITVAAGKKGQAGVKKEPSPLVIMSEGLMRIDFAEAAIPVLVGPPEPPTPTKVRFERNVVALMIHPGGDPDQLNCDTLKLTLIPAEKPAEPKPGKPQAVEVAARSDGRADPDRAVLGAIVGVLALVAPDAGSSPAEGSSPFGNLTLQKAHAIGHAVWLQLREQESKVLCNELIHERRAPYEPDRTYFRGDATRQVWLEKIDRDPVEADDAKTAKTVNGSPAKRPKKGKISGVTHVVTVDVTLFDMGGGSMDLSDIVARGPGKLETRPDLKEPVEQIAIWQDELTVQNFLGPDSQLLQKKVTLTGSRPSFVDSVKKTSIDSAQIIYVWLKPKPSSKPKETSPATAPDGDAARTPATGQDAFAVASAPAGDAQAANQAKNDTGMGLSLGGGGLQIEHLQAFVDVHFLAPGKKMDARGARYALRRP